MNAPVQIFEAEPLWIPLSNEARILHYFGASARTIWRWRKLGFPIRRVKTGARGVAVIYLREARKWLEKNAALEP